MKIKGLSKRGDFYYYRPPQVGGIRPPRIALGTTDLTEAIEAVNQIRREANHTIAKLRLSGEIQRYFASRTFTSRSRQATESTLRQFELWAGNPMVTEITADRVNAWRESLTADGKASATITTYLRRLQGFCTWLKDSGKIHTHPFNKIKVGRPKRSKGVTFCSKEQRDQLLKACDRDDLRFVLMAGFFIGMRRIEIVEATPHWFRTPGLVEISDTPTFKPKDKESRVIHYGQRFTDFLASYDYSPEQPFMVRPDKHHRRNHYRWDFRRPFEALVTSCGMPWVTPHVMRHSFATGHVMAGTPISIVAEWLGDDIRTTSDYYVAYAPTDQHVGNLD